VTNNGCTDFGATNERMMAMNRFKLFHTEKKHKIFIMQHNFQRTEKIVFIRFPEPA